MIREKRNTFNQCYRVRRRASDDAAVAIAVAVAVVPLVVRERRHWKKEMWYMRWGLAGTNQSSSRRLKNPHHFDRDPFSCVQNKMNDNFVSHLVLTWTTQFAIKRLKSSNREVGAKRAEKHISIPHRNNQSLIRTINIQSRTIDDNSGFSCGYLVSTA